MFNRLRSNYAFAQLGAPVVPDALGQRWGLMPPAAYAQALRECLERDYVPRFGDCGIDAQAAWDEL